MLSTRWSRLPSTLGSSSSSSFSSQSLAFFTILQNAAGRAWCRRATGKSCFHSTVHDQTGNCSFGCGNLTGLSPDPAFPQKTYHPRARVRREMMKPVVCHLHSDSLTKDDVKFFDPGRCVDASIHSVLDHGDESGTFCVWGDPLLARYPFGSQLQPSTQWHSLPPATSRAILYRNLSRLSCRVPPITLPQFMDYHDLYSETQSTRSYNFLISMAIRTASFGSVQWLLQSMATAKINRNLETHKLVIRWQIRIGAWDAAWQMLTAPGVASNLRNTSVSAGWLDFLWLEFFGSLKRRSIRRKGVVIEEPDDPFVVYAQRFLLLMENRPAFSLTQAKPRVIHSIAYILLQLHQREQALQLVQTYFSHLPSQITPDSTRQCLDIINILIVFGSRARGLKKFYEHRRILTSLLTLHPSFRPTSTTLFLLLGSLRGAMRSGVLASECLSSFKRKWGADIEDHKVRLRVASLALKQGRLDLSSDMLTDAQLANERASEPVTIHDEQYSSRRPRFKSIFRGTGKLVAHQIRLEKRLRTAKQCRRMHEIQDTSS